MSNDLIPFALIADDDALIRMDVVHILEDAGFRVHEAANVEEALSILDHAGDSIRLLFTDVQMPPSKRDGLELARECAKGWPHIKILVASGRAKPGLGDMPKGGVFIGKPFSADVVYDRLQELLPDGEKPETLKHRVR
ncbi:response regulator [Falsirhodobacter sp. 20TX0035]|uniref:response regulator n=1 Tax=Falsirhodobacter sp. 20TX0035 TaxID=3022019 RepID=UPI0023306DB9|nr:response regulator [Falsirhodobacter sp. 20TX0035]MDB6455017.1 response regulator [Falsirhodobacter sp. 20TX0035]